MLTKEIVVDRIEVTASNAIQVRERISVLEDGTELSFAYHRYVLEPSADLSGQPDQVKAIAIAAWGSL